MNLQLTYQVQHYIFAACLPSDTVLLCSVGCRNRGRQYTYKPKKREIVDTIPITGTSKAPFSVGVRNTVMPGDGWNGGKTDTIA